MQIFTIFMSEEENRVLDCCVLNSENSEKIHVFFCFHHHHDIRQAGAAVRATAAAMRNSKREAKMRECYRATPAEKELCEVVA